jgi:hypothetical protein
MKYALMLLTVVLVCLSGCGLDKVSVPENGQQVENKKSIFTNVTSLFPSSVSVSVWSRLSGTENYYRKIETCSKICDDIYVAHSAAVDSHSEVSDYVSVVNVSPYGNLTLINTIYIGARTSGSISPIIGFGEGCIIIKKQGFIDVVSVKTASSIAQIAISEDTITCKVIESMVITFDSLDLLSLYDIHTGCLVAQINKSMGKIFYYCPKETLPDYWLPVVSSLTFNQEKEQAEYRLFKVSLNAGIVESLPSPFILSGGPNRLDDIFVRSGLFIFCSTFQMYDNGSHIRMFSMAGEEVFSQSGRSSIYRGTSAEGQKEYFVQQEVRFYSDDWSKKGTWLKIINLDTFSVKMIAVNAPLMKIVQVESSAIYGINLKTGEIIILTP